MEIKGLANRVADARKAINDARNASVDLGDAANAFAADANEITKQIKKHHEDLKFEAETLGNSGGSSGQSEDRGFSGDTKP